MIGPVGRGLAGVGRMVTEMSRPNGRGVTWNSRIRMEDCGNEGRVGQGLCMDLQAKTGGEGHE